MATTKKSDSSKTVTKKPAVRKSVKQAAVKTDEVKVASVKKISPARAAANADAEDLSCARVVGHPQSGLHLNHLLPLPVVAFLLRLLENLEKPPPLCGAQRTRLNDAHEVADPGRIVLIVRV